MRRPAPAPISGNSNGYSGYESSSQQSVGSIGTSTEDVSTTSSTRDRSTSRRGVSRTKSSSSQHSTSSAGSHQSGSTGLYGGGGRRSRQRQPTSNNNNNNVPSTVKRSNLRRNISGNGLRRTTSNKKRSTSSYPSISSIIFTVLIGLFVVTDMIYLYKLSNEATYNTAIQQSQMMLSSSSTTTTVGGSDTQKKVSTTTTTTSVSYNNTIPTTSSRSHQNKLYDDAVQHGFHSLEDKERIFEILQQAGLDVNDLDQETIDELPTWNQITSLYGDRPYVIGLERCEEFVASTDPTVRFFGIAGTFNSGTNLVHELMAQNCQITERMMVYGNESKGVRWQVPWGKHYPASHRGVHDTKTDKAVPYTNSIPLVAVRDPWMWLQSMCRHHYTAFWPHSEKHCPNLVATENDIQSFPRLKKLYYESNILGVGEKVSEPLIPVTVKYDTDIYEHTSLAHFWSEWYRLYLDADFPRIMVRFEDMLFHAKEVIEQLCACGGGVPREDRPPGRDFVHISESAKLGTAAHGKHKTNLLGAIIRYGTFEHRLDHVNPDDILAGKKYFETDILESFGYQHPSIDDLS